MENPEEINPLSLESIIMEESQGKNDGEFELEIDELPVLDDKLEPQVNLFDFNQHSIESPAENLSPSSSNDKLVESSIEISFMPDSDMNVHHKKEENVQTANEQFIGTTMDYNNTDVAVETPTSQEIQNDVLTEEESTVSLEDILKKSKETKEESDDEFDFELPTQKPKAETKESDNEFDFELQTEKPQEKAKESVAIELQTEKLKEKMNESGDKYNTEISTNNYRQSENRSESKTVTLGESYSSQKTESHNKYICDSKLVDQANVPESKIVTQSKQVPVSEKYITDQHVPGPATETEVSYIDNDIREDGMGTVALTSAENEWANVQTITPEFVDENERSKKAVVTTKPLLSFYEMEEYFSSHDFSSVKGNIHISVDRHGFSALKHFLFGPPKLHRDLHVQRDMVFCMAASAMDNSDQIQVRALQTIYRSLTGSRFDCNRYGSHWEEIGFQGNDPSTDLRGAGLLALFNLIHLLRDPQRKMIAQDIYKLSLHPTQNFPFCLMGINMSRITLQTLREDYLNRECNSRKNVLTVVNDFYTGIYLQMYQIWKSKGKTIKDSGFVIKQVETAAKKNPRAVFKNLEESLAKKKSSVNLDNMDIGGQTFLSVVDTDAGQY